MEYVKEVDKFIKVTACGGGRSDTKEIVYKYEKIDEEINLYTAVATNVEHNNVEWIYKSLSGVEYSIDTFEFTEDNYQDFPHLKYTFRKNDNDKYYVYDVKEIDK